jgi:hypothetical protein
MAQDSDRIPTLGEKKTSMWTRLLDLILIRKRERQEIRSSVGLLFGISMGVVFTLIYSYSSPPNRYHVLAVSLLSGGAALTTGLLVGFIFGIPRAVQNTSVPPTTGVTVRANTNLEQISDWLTKIIVGVSLVQLSTIPGKLQRLADYFSTAFGASAVPGSVVLTLFGYFGILGFLLGYLWARVYLMEVFAQSDKT